MESRFNIPAPALVKPERDAGVEKVCRLKVAVPQGDVEASGRNGSFKTNAKKSFQVFPRPPVPETDTGGWVEYTKARE
jgi:hypothetical protein